MRLTYADRQWDDDEFDEAVDTTRLALRHLGLKAGHRLGVMTGNTPLRVFLQAACTAEEIVPVLIHARIHESGMAAQLRRAGVVVAVTDSGDVRNNVRTEVPIVKANPRGERWDELQRYRLAPPSDEAVPLAAILYTSGTTGTPRAVAIPRTALAAHAEAAIERLGLGRDDVWLCALPLFHVGGHALVDRCLRLGASLILQDAFDAKAASDTIRRQGATHASLVPTMLHRLLEADEQAAPEHVRCVLVGGDRTPPDLAQRALERGWPVYITYGLTEATSQVATATPDEVRADPTTSGTPLTGVTVRIVDEEGKAVAAGKEGGIVVQGPTVGFDLATGPDAAGVLTGDLGRLDESGRLFVTGRSGTRIVTGGENVDPVEVETVLRSHAAVMEACVVGLDDAEWGSLVAAALVIRPGMDVGVEELKEFAAQRLAPHQVPRRYLFLKHLPKTPTGKPDPQMVRTWLARQSRPTTPR